MDTRFCINIPILGPVSVGKSTLVNSLFVDTYSDMKIKRTTMVPQVYHEIDKLDKLHDISNIRETNRKINEELINKTENGCILEIDDMKEIEYYVPRVYDLLDLAKNVYLSIYDMPGLNDARTKEIYFEYIRKNFYKFDIILFVVDINSAMNTSDEIDILKLILEETKRNKIEHDIVNYLLILVNKCDSMYIDNDRLMLEEEHEEMLRQVKKTIIQYIKQINPDLKSYILPISCEDSYIYRMYKRNPDTKMDIKHFNKFGRYELGKSQWNKLKESEKKDVVKKFIKQNYVQNLDLCGFNNFKLKLKRILSESNQLGFIQNHTKYQIGLIIDHQKYDISNELSFFIDKYQELNDINTIFKDLECVLDMDIYFKNKVNKYVNGYLNYVKLMDKIKKDDLIIIKKNLDYIMNIYHLIDMLNDIERVNEVNQDIMFRINEYNIAVLVDNGIKIEDMLTYFDELQKYHYSDLDKFIFDVMIKNKNIITLSDKEIIDVVNLVVNKFEINNSHKILFFYDLLINKYNSMYESFNKKKPNIAMIDLYMKHNYWQNLYICYENTYSKYLIILKMSMNKLYNYMLDNIITIDQKLHNSITDKIDTNINLIENVLVIIIQNYNKNMDNLLEM